MTVEILNSLQTELKTFIGKATDEQKTFGAVLTETKDAIGTLQTQIQDLDKRITEANTKAASDGPALSDELKSNKELEALLQRKGGRARFDLSPKSSNELSRKAISSASFGYPTYGIMPGERDAGIVWKPRPELVMRDVLPSRPTSLGEIYWVAELTRPALASPVAEYTGLKPLAEPTFTTDKEPVVTIAVLMLASKQILDDFPELEGFLRTEGMASVNQAVDQQLLYGSGVSPNLHGLVPQAQAWDPTLLTPSDGYEYADILAGARQQVAEDDEIQSNPFYVLHPGDAWKIRRAKDSTGRYIFDGPTGGVGPLTLWGAPAVETTQMTKGSFLYGSGDPRAVEIRDRQGMTVELSTEDSTNFRYNLVTIRFELRLALVVKRPDAFVQGSLTQSPA